MHILRDVPWEQLADQLDLKQNTAIDSKCSRDTDRVTCCLREVVKGYIATKPPDQCNNTVNEIATTLEQLSNFHTNTAFQLRNKYNISKHNIQFICIHRKRKFATCIIIIYM